METKSVEIGKIKSLYGISRKTLSLISGISANALMRYESGEVPQKSYQLLINSMMDIRTFEVLFHVSKQLLRQSVINKIEKIIASELHWRHRDIREFSNRKMII